ncbi:MAG: CHAD domain-containing protein [Candidatus Dormibacteria bacterium]
MAEASACCHLSETEIESRQERLRWALARLPLASDFESVHDLRVSLRQLRAASSAFAGCLSRPTQWGSRLRRAEKALGTLRDAEVRLRLLDQVLGPVAVAVDRGDDPRLLSHPTEPLALDPGRIRPGLRGREMEARRALAEETAAEIERLRTQALKGSSRARLQRLGTAPRLRRGHLSCDAHELARNQLPRLFRRAARRSHGQAGLHRRRGEIRRLRYRLELFGAVLDPETPTVLKELRHLQALLGRLHDLAVLRGWIEGSARQLRHELRPALRRLALRVELEQQAAREAAEVELARLDSAAWWEAAMAAALTEGPSASAAGA